VAGVVLYIGLTQPTTEGHGRLFKAGDLDIVVGNGFLEGDTGHIGRFSNNIAIISSGNVRLDADRLKVLQVTTGGDNRREARFFWRAQNDPEDLNFIEIRERGSRRLDLGSAPRWNGMVSEIGLLFYDDEGRGVTFTSLELAPRTLGSSLAALAQDWREQSTWNQQSVHFLHAGARHAAIPLPVLIAAWFLLCLLFALVMQKPIPRPQLTLLLCAVAAWLILDARWTVNRLAQSWQTITYYADGESHLDMGEDADLQRLAKGVMETLGAEGGTVLVLSEHDKLDFEILRLKYHLLPLPAYSHDGPPRSSPRHVGDHALILRRRQLAPGEKPAEARTFANSLQKRRRAGVALIRDDPSGVLLKMGGLNP
jgi:hypothetical protein